MKRPRPILHATRLSVGLCLALALVGGAAAADAPAGLALHLGFDQDGGTVVVDQSGQNNKAKLDGAIWTSTGYRGGGCELVSGNTIRVTNTTALNPKQATFAFWFKGGRRDPAMTMVMLSKGRGRGYLIGISGESKESPAGKLIAVINGRHTAISEATVGDGGWHHAAVTCDGKELRLYVDGQPQEKVVPCGEEISNSADDLLVGMEKPKGASRDKLAGYAGVIDELMIFSRALNAEEVKSILGKPESGGAGGRARFTKDQVAGRLRQLKRLYEEGLLTDSFYQERVRECEVTE